MADIRIISTGRTFKQIDGTLALFFSNFFPRTLNVSTTNRQRRAWTRTR